MQFDEIPNRAKKSGGRLWNLTNRLGDSPLLNPIISLAAPIITSILSTLIFLSYLFFVNYAGVEGFFLTLYFLSRNIQNTPSSLGCG